MQIKYFLHQMVQSPNATEICKREIFSRAYRKTLCFPLYLSNAITTQQREQWNYKVKTCVCRNRFQLCPYKSSDPKDSLSFILERVATSVITRAPRRGTPKRFGALIESLQSVSRWYTSCANLMVDYVELYPSFRERCSQIETKCFFIAFQGEREVCVNIRKIILVAVVVRVFTFLRCKIKKKYVSFYISVCIFVF